MSERFNGGPAFPVDTRGSGPTEDSGTFGHQTSPSTWQFSGMTLRDYFAAKALPGVYAEFWRTTDHCPPDWEVGLAHDAYRMADAMLKVRTAT